MSKFHPSRQSIGENTRSLLAQVLHQFRSAFIGVGLFSALINLLMLSGSMFMLQVYDRVLPSKSVPTLIGLSLIFLGLYAFQAILDLIRTRVLVRIGSAFDELIAERVYGVVIKLPLKGARTADALQPVRDLDTIRNFLTGLGPTALFDLPWMPLYLALCFAFNFYIGLTATVGAIIIVALTAYHRDHVTRSHSRCGEVRRCPQRIRRSEPSSQRGASRSGHDGKDGRPLARGKRAI